MTATKLAELTYPFEPSIAQAAEKFLQAAQQLGRSRWASCQRAACVPYLFDGMEAVFAAEQEPGAGISRLLDQLTAYCTAATANELPQRLGQAALEDFVAPTEQATIEQTTGQHYGSLFSGFSPTSYWDETVKLLRTRLERNEIELTNLPKLRVLDAGCGGGRYTVAWRLLGANEAVGVDISEIGLDNARKRVTEAQLDNVSFQSGSVLDLPASNDSFDIVFSNGVLHHTVDWVAGINELLRVLKPGGLGWLYLIENPGGLFWSLIDVMRALMKQEQHAFARAALQLLGIPGNRIFYMLDHVMAPINLRLTPNEIETTLRNAGAINIRRLTRGVDFDRIEQIHQGAPYAEAKYGVGENRYVFSKG